MAGLKRFQYITKDHEDIVEDCIARIKQVYGENYWNDFEEDNAGRMLVESFAYITDLLLFYLDRQANETYLATATERQNIINMCKLIAYTPKSATAAQVSVTFSIDKIHDSDITISENTQITTNDGLVFETKNDAVIKAGDLSVDVVAVEGETFEEIIGTSDGEAWQEFYLQRSGVIEILNAVIADKNWEITESLIDQDEDAEVFTAEIDAWRRAEIFFGDGKTGKIPPNNEKITVRYRVGGGVIGNIAPNTLNIVRDVATDLNGEKVQVKVTNPDWASGGEEPESINSIKLWAPRYFETQNRCVTELDYETFAMRFNGVFKAKAIVDEELRKIGEANVIHIYVLTYGNSNVAIANQALKDSLLAYLNKYKMLTDWLEIEDGKFSEVDFSGSITIVDGFNSNTVLENIKSNLKILMDLDTRDMGQVLRISDVYSIIDNTEGVDFVELTAPTQSITPDINELLILGNINFNTQ